MNEIVACLDVLAKGADEQVERAFEVVSKAMQLQSTGNAWEALLHDEQEAHDKYDKSHAELIAIKADASYLSQEGNLTALNGKKETLEESLGAYKLFHEQNHA